MKNFTIKEFRIALTNLGLTKGDNIFIFPETFRLGRILNVRNKEEHYKTLLSEIIKIVGNKGSIFINTYTFDNSRKNKNFVYESKICTSGYLSTYFLKLKGVQRSIHPIFSVSGIGRMKKYVCSNNSVHNYGYLSPYHKMMLINTKILSLGAEISRSPFLHCSEYFMGVPYNYNKIFKKKVLKNRKEIKKSFVSFVRYLNLNLNYKFTKLEKILKKKRIVKTKKLGRGYLSLANSKIFFNSINEILAKNIHGLLNATPKYDKGKFPYK